MLFRRGMVRVQRRQQVLDGGLRGMGWRMRRGLLNRTERWDYGLLRGVVGGVGRAWHRGGRR